MKCMPELLEDQPDAGQVIHGGADVQDHSPMKGRPTSANGAVNTWPSTEVSANEPTADGFDQPASNESDSESDSDGGVQACDLLVHKEDDFDSDRMQQD